jgi:aminoglycoside 2'-N-acetyltransferase I
VSELRTGHTADLDAAVLTAARALMYDVFGDEFEESDWEHALGGVHALIWEADDLIGHASVVMRRMLHDGRALRCGYVEAVAVRSDYQRRGLGGTLMETIERVIHAAYDLGALGGTDEGAPLYLRRGWKLWEGPLFALTPDGVVRTSDVDGAVYVLPASAPLDVAGELTCDWRDGDVW